MNASLVSGLNAPEGIAILGSDLFVANYGGNTIGEYTISGATVNASLVSGLGLPWGIATVPSTIPTPEPPTSLTLGVGLQGLSAVTWYMRRLV